MSFFQNISGIGIISPPCGPSSSSWSSRSSPGLLTPSKSSGNSSSSSSSTSFLSSSYFNFWSYFSFWSVFSSSLPLFSSSLLIFINLIWFTLIVTIWAKSYSSEIHPGSWKGISRCDYQTYLVLSQCMSADPYRFNSFAILCFSFLHFVYQYCSSDYFYVSCPIYFSHDYRAVHPARVIVTTKLWISAKLFMAEWRIFFLDSRTLALISYYARFKWRLTIKSLLKGLLEVSLLPINFSDSLVN